MSDELNKPNGQEQPEDNSGSHQPDQTLPGTVEAAGSCELRSAPSKGEDADPGLSDQLVSESESQRCDSIPQITAEIANMREQADTPPAAQDDQTKGTSGSAVLSEEPLDDAPVSSLGSDNDLTETDRLALLSYEKNLGRGNVADPEYDEVEFQTNPTHDLVRRGEQICVGVVKWLGPNPTLTTYVSGVSKNGHPIDVPDMPRAVYETLLLPSDVVGYCSARKVFDSIFAVLQYIPMLSGKQRELLTYWCMAGWFADVLPSIPRLTITGPKYAADLLFQVLRCVCRRPVLLAGINPAVLKSNSDSRADAYSLCS